MKMTKLLMGIFLSLSILSCSKATDSELGVNLAGSSAYLIDAKAQSCVNRVAVLLSPATTSPSTDVTAHYYSFEGATISWKNTTDTAYIVQMKVEFTNANVTNTCTISGDELLSIFYDFKTGATGTAWDGTLAHAASAVAPTTLTSQCKIRCGGVSVADAKKVFTATGTMTLIGFQRSPSGEEKPIKAKTTVKLIYQ